MTKKRQEYSQQDENWRKTQFKIRISFSFYLRENHCLHFLYRIHYKISQQISVTNVFSAFEYLATRSFFADDVNNTTFFTLLRQQTNVIINQIKSSQKTSVVRNVIWKISVISRSYFAHAICKRITVYSSHWIIHNMSFENKRRKRKHIVTSQHARNIDLFIKRSHLVLCRCAF
jgi:hypothetical protein